MKYPLEELYYELYHYLSEVDSDLLSNKRLSFVHEEPLNSAFFKRDMLESMLSAFESVRDVYDMLKEAV